MTLTNIFMKLAFVTGSLSRQAGGLFFSVRFLSQALARSFVDVDVLGVEDDYFIKDAPAWGKLPLKVAHGLGPSNLGFAPGLGKLLDDSCYDLAHTQGLWMYSSAVVNRWAKKTGRPYLVTPRGMLDSWALNSSGLSKRLVGALYENRHLRGAACLHALCEAEAASIRDYGLVNPIAVIPNGVQTSTPSASSLPSWKFSLPTEAKVLLYLGRLHPKKGLSNLLMAWNLVQHVALDSKWHLVIAGWSQEGHQSELAAQVERYGTQHCVHFVGPQFNEDKEACYSHADAFILPSYSEGLPMSVLEAWSHSLPVLMTRKCNIPEGFDAGAAFAMETDPSSIASALQSLFLMSEDDRLEMGSKAFDLVEKKFAWARVAEQMHDVYSWVLNGGSRPSCVQID